MKPNTRDLTEFPIIQLKLAAKLLLIYRSAWDRTSLLGYPISVEWNPNSDTVFLIDEEYQTAILRGEYLEDWLVCPSCMGQGFRDTLAQGTACCQQHSKISLITKQAA